MLSVAATVLGGIGLFLLGMILMTDGLKTASGSALRDVLARFTDTTPRALASGVGLTALIQSSSATTVTTIGFVSAGLMTFPQGLGVILGANLGSTSTGWLVGLFGLKLSIGTIALPLVGIGALMRLLMRGRGAHIGMALAGFGVIFVGIDVMQTGTAGFAEAVDLSAWADPSWMGWALLVGIGAIMTVLLQSSSAAVAMTLAALYSGAIQLDQAAALVIGQNMGTTVKAALISIGASVPAKRTALAHILFNLGTGVVAFALLPLFVWMVDAWFATLTQGDEALILAAFHTVFNLLGILIFLPLLTPFAAWVERLIPDDTRPLTRYLDDSVATVPAMATVASRRAVTSIAAATMEHAARKLPPHETDWTDIEAGLADTRRFLAQVDADEIDPSNGHVSTLHALDHLQRLVRALQESPPPEDIPTSTEIDTLEDTLRPALRAASQYLNETVPHQNGDPGAATQIEQEMASVAESLASRGRAERPRMLRRVAAGGVPPNNALQTLAYMRWLDRVAYHAWRITHHLLATTPTPDELDAATAFSERNDTHTA